MNQGLFQPRNITVSFLRAFARQRARQLQELLHRQERLRVQRQVLQQRQRQGLRWGQQVQRQQAQQRQGLQRVQVREPLLFCRKRSVQRQRPTGQRSSDFCSWFGFLRQIFENVPPACTDTHLKRDQALQIGRKCISKNVNPENPKKFLAHF